MHIPPCRVPVVLYICKKPVVKLLDLSFFFLHAMVLTSWQLLSGLSLFITKNTPNYIIKSIVFTAQYILRTRYSVLLVASNIPYGVYSIPYAPEPST